MSLFQISTPLLKQRKILQVDYFTSKMIETSRDNFQGWDQVIKVSKQQEKLSRYFQSEENHNQKYYRFKKLVNQKYFKKSLPEEYRNTTITQTLKGESFLYSPSFQKITSSLMSDSIPMDSSVSDFITNYESFKGNSPVAVPKRNSPIKNGFADRKKSKSISRYWPLQQNFSVILEQEEQLPIKSRKAKQTSIFHRSLGKGVQKSFMTMNARPMSQQISRTTEKVKQIINNSLNPEQKNIRHRLSTLTQKKTLNQKYKKKEQNSILDTISKQKLMKFLSQSRSIDPKRKGIFSLHDLTDFQKFHLSFVKYMKLKTLNKIDKYAFQSKVKQKHGNLEKFQNFILEQFPMQSDSKRKLEKIFENITWEFKMAERRKQVEKR